MADLEKRISGDWIELREKANDLHALLELLAVLPPELRDAADGLRHCVEQGIIEFKRTQLAPTLVALEAARYTSLEAQELETRERALAALLLSTLVQRLVCVEAVPLSKSSREEPSVSADDLQVSAILADVNARVKTEPALRGHTAVKNILMQVHRYNSENKKMRELVATIKPEMRQSFLANFTKTFDAIIASIRRNYSVLLQEQVAAVVTRKEGFSLAEAPLKELAPLLMNQAREVSRFRSTLAHAREERFKTREVLVRLYDSRPAVLKLVEDEAQEYRRLCQHVPSVRGEDCVGAMAAAFRDEVAAILDRQGKKEA